MYSHAWPEDFSYSGEIARWISETVKEVIQYEVIPDPQLTARILEIDTGKHVIKIRSNQPPCLVHDLVDRAVRFVIGGSGLSPGFRIQPKLRLVTSEPEPDSEACPSCGRVS